MKAIGDEGKFGELDFLYLSPNMSIIRIAV
jgi:hypothetical protein